MDRQEETRRRTQVRYRKYLEKQKEQEKKDQKTTAGGQGSDGRRRGGCRRG
jgi:hypothetical protein